MNQKEFTALSDIKKSLLSLNGALLKSRSNV